MVDDFERSLYAKALGLKGQDSQLTVLMEEAAEIIKAVSKYKRRNEGFDTEENLIEKMVDESADIIIMIEQMLIIFDREEQFKAYKNKKLLRLQERLKSLEERRSE